MVSFRSASSFAEETHTEDISVFPNPVDPAYSGQVGITGLARNAMLKITDVKGRLVKDLVAVGGTASWDLTTHTGGQVSPGVYLLFSSTEDGQDTMVGKIAVLR